MMQMRATGALVALAVGLFLGSARQAGAGVLITVDQVGSNVVMTGSGSMDLTGAILGASGGAVGAQANPNSGLLLEGPTTAFSYNGYDATGGSAFGTGFGVLASSGAADPFGVMKLGALSFVDLPTTYVSGASLSATDTYDNQTFASLGLTPGTYVWHLPHDTMTVQVDAPVAATPEPASFVLFGMAITGLGFARWRKRKQAS